MKVKVDKEKLKELGTGYLNVLTELEDCNEERVTELESKLEKYKDKIKALEVVGISTRMVGIGTMDFMYNGEIVVICECEFTSKVHRQFVTNITKICSSPYVDSKHISINTRSLYASVTDGIINEYSYVGILNCVLCQPEDNEMFCTGNSFKVLGDENKEITIDGASLGNRLLRGYKEGLLIDTMKAVNSRTCRLFVYQNTALSLIIGSIKLVEENK